MARRRRETNRDGGAGWLLIGGLFVLFLNAANGAQQEAGGGETKPKEPQFYLDLGLMKFAVTYKENKLNDKLKLSKSSVSYFLAHQSNPFHKHLLKATLREDLVPCDNFLADRPEMESLIDCKPLDSHVLSKVPADQATRQQQQQQPMSTKYALEYKSKIEVSLWLPFLNMVPKQDFHFYPFEPNYTRQSVRRILKDNGMPNQDLGFGPYSVTTGHLLVANLSERVRCTANLFISVNLTEPIPEKDPTYNYPEAFHVRVHLLTKFRENGGLVSLQDASCRAPGSSDFSLHSDFTFIYRKQFPYVTYSQTIASKPFSAIWSYNGIIKQIKDPQSTEAYNTSVQIESLSVLDTAFNFKLHQNFTNKDFATGTEQMLLVYPIVSALVQSDWTQDSLVKSLSLLFKQNLAPTMLKDGPDFFKDPKLMFSYSDKPQERHVTLTMTAARDLFKDLQTSLDGTIVEYMYEIALDVDEAQPEEPQHLFYLGPMEFVITSEENELNDKLRLSKSSMSYFLAHQSNPFHKHLLKVTLREDLVPCDNFLADRPEMESLIDCKPLDSHVLSKVPAEQATQQQHPMLTKYVKRTALGYKSKIEKLPWLSFLNMVLKQNFHFYPFEPDYTQQSVRRILKDNGMPNQDLGFGPYSVTTGHLLVANLSERVRCTANLFISVNLTEPIPEKDPTYDYSEAFHIRKHLLTKFRENGGLVSLQDVSCGPLGASGFSLDSDFTFIYRKQFPYVTCSHTIDAKPVSEIWSYNGTIRQIKDLQSTEAYNTSVQIESQSGLVTAFNFKLDQNFTNKDFATGTEQMLLVHPIVTAFVQSNWTQDSLVKSLSLLFKQNLAPTLLKDGPDFFKDPKLMFSYSDKPQERHVTLTMTAARDLFKDLQSSLDEMIEGSMYEAAPPRRDGLSAEPMKALGQLVNLGVRDEL